ncbi:MAG TPA: 4Fe-4S dicluster domain-containing protein, partial [Anaeromyxobacteraceae bacterium]|nr:4Fe-4S dicluster domain-containing protein [Anaeromyxobacteraceae bacterium]
GGESALRLDVPGGRLLAFGAAFRIDELFVVLAATFVLVAALALVTLLFGRVWCGWSCPQTVLGDLTSWAVTRLQKPSVHPERSGRAAAAKSRGGAAFAVLWIALVSAVVSAATLWYFVPPQEFFARLAAGALGPVLGGAWAILGGTLFVDLVIVRARFCATTCPYAKLQGVLFDRHTLVVAYDARRAADCVDCKACVRVCPTGIDIRDGLQAECIACGACIDACRPIMEKLKRAPDLVGWAFGDPGAARRLLRPGAVALGVALAASVALLAGFVTGRSGLGLNAIAADGFAPRRGADGRVVNVYAVSLENRRGERLDVSLALEVGEAGASLRPARVALAPGERKTVRVVATAAGAAGVIPATLRAEAAGPGGPERADVALSFFVPEVR